MVCCFKFSYVLPIHILTIACFCNNVNRNFTSQTSNKKIQLLLWRPLNFTNAVKEILKVLLQKYKNKLSKQVKLKNPNN